MPPRSPLDSSSRKAAIRLRSTATFSLVELLLAVVAGTALVSALAYTITGQIRGTRTQELAQRSRDDANRIDYLIQTEASEAVTTSQGQTISNCVSAANGTTSLFSLTVPKPTGQFDTATNIATIYYYSTTTSGLTDLRRCGPAIQRNGSLDFSANVDGVVAANTALCVVTSTGTIPANCNPQCTAGTPSSSNREVVYRLQLNDQPGGYRPPCAIARARAFRVVDPTTTTTTP